MFVLLTMLWLGCPEPPVPTLNNPCEKHCLPEQSTGCSVRNNACHRSLAIGLDWYTSVLEKSADPGDTDCRRKTMQQTLDAFRTSLDLHLSCGRCSEAEAHPPYSAVQIAQRLLDQCSNQFRWGHLDEKRVATRLIQVSRLLRQDRRPGMARLADQLEHFVTGMNPTPTDNG
ncbi:hypothetical protein [Acanthopleuribacter pedis]|uniref:Uncharacterized protein n=1 Tax=Acanthopleuribacter pedis TaxID=442870 RepID=A0A8J7QHM0_9BACT|nr:hypothetical protein [Acanthopleuribacter pedis]MBO1320681.1 hypothetical protein [Acanthopleuribacter pedis]